MGSNYIVQLTQSSYCPHCNERVSLLSDKDGKKFPAFYICWNCEHISEIGKGPVQEETKGKILDLNGRQMEVVNRLAKDFITQLKQENKKIVNIRYITEFCSYDWYVGTLGTPSCFATEEDIDIGIDMLKTKIIQEVKREGIEIEEK
jgi:hypothetical protein